MRIIDKGLDFSGKELATKSLRMRCFEIARRTKKGFNAEAQSGSGFWQKELIPSP
ncbi:hypothetical protein JOD20_002210 [Herpetosiphon giganteus]|nr:hypothetical protein [Herpetosiphon giganteus]